MEENLITNLARRWGRQKPGIKSRSASKYNQFPGRSISIGIVVSGKKGSQASAHGENLRLLLDKSSLISLMSLRSPAKRGTGGFKSLLSNLHRFIDMIKSVSVIHLILDNYRDWWLMALPVAVIGRFYQKQIIIESIGCWTVKINKYPFWLMKLWINICHMILVPAKQLEPWTRALGVGVEVEESAPMINLESVTGKKITTIQPSMLADCRFLPKEYSGEIVAAFCFVKNKYPRAELTILVDSEIKRNEIELDKKLIGSGVNIEAVHADLKLEELIDTCELFISCQTEPFIDSNILMAVATGSLIFSGKSSALTNYLKNDCNFEPIIFSGRSDLADRIIELIENPEHLEELSIQARGLAERFAWDNVSPIWLERYERVISTNSDNQD